MSTVSHETLEAAATAAHDVLMEAGAPDDVKLVLILDHETDVQVGCSDGLYQAWQIVSEAEFGLKEALEGLAAERAKTN